MSLETRIYQNGERLQLRSLLVTSLRDMRTGNYLAKQLAIRDIKGKYRKSILGVFWDVLMPLSTALVWVLLQNSGTVVLDDTGVPYPLYAFSGTLLWSMLSEAINMPLQSTKASKGILSKINIPKEALILSGFYKLVFNSIFKLILLIFFFVYFQITPGLTVIWFPFALLGLIIAGTTFGLFITPIGMLYNDVAKAVSFGLRLVMYITPVVFVIPESGMMKILMELNPLTPLILVTRHLLLGLELSYLSYYFGILIGLIPLFCLSLVLYRVAIPIIVERN